MKEKLVFARKASGLVKAMTWRDILIIAISAPAGSGILYYSVSTASEFPGASVALSFLIGMIVFLPVVFLAGVGSGMISRSGSLFILISRVVDPTVSYCAAFLYFFGYSLAVGVVAYVVSSVIGGVIVVAGIASDASSLSAVGKKLQTPLWQTLSAVLILALVWWGTMAGVRVFRNLMRILFLITMLSFVASVAYFLTTSTGSAEQSFNSVWGADLFQKIIALAHQMDWESPAFSWSETIKALLIVVWSFGGIELISNASGEVRQTGRSLLKGFMAAWVGLGALYAILAYAVYRPFGQFIGAYDFLWDNHRESLQEIMPNAVDPSVPFYISSIVSSPLLGVVIASGISLWLLTTMLPYFFAPSRVLFALAMDRAIPSMFAGVRQKTGAPTWATHATLVVAAIGVLFSLLDVQVVLGTILFAVFFVFWLYGLSALLLPYRCPAIYENSPIKATIGGIPLVSIVGLIAFGVGWFLIFFTVRSMSPSVCITTAVIMVLGLAVYFWQYLKSKKLGVDLDKVYSEIPPV